jgi:Protein of unknown function (DUF3187)
MNLTNHFIKDEAPRESIVLDGERTHIRLDARYGISRNFEVGLVIPYIIEGEGFTDGFIDWYHNTFGFAEGAGITRQRIACFTSTKKTSGFSSRSTTPAMESEIFK